MARRTGTPTWKEPLLRAALTARALLRQGARRRTRPGSVHDYMHAKVTVADDTVFVGSFNLSHSGELNAENVLEIDGFRSSPSSWPRSSTRSAARYPGRRLGDSLGADQRP